MLTVKALMFIALFLISVISHLLYKYYNSLSEKELKRQALSGKTNHQILYQIVKNKSVTFLYLNLITISAFAGAVSVLAINFKTYYLALTILLTTLGLLFLSRQQFLVLRLSKIFSSVLLNLIIKTKPYVGWLAKIIDKYFRSTSEIYLYELEDLIELINAQKNKKINRIDEKRLKLAINALNFSGKTVKDLMVPKKLVKFVDGEETISTILIDELHKTGQRHFPVYKDSKSNIIGVLDLDVLVEKRLSGKIAWAVDSPMKEININKSLNYVLEIFLKSKQQIYLVVDEDKKTKGLISIDQVLAKLLNTD